MTGVLFTALFICLGALALYHIKVLRTMNRLDKILDKAICGDFEVESYNESRLSKIEAKLSHFLGASKLKKGQIEYEQAKIHSLISDISHQTKTPIANVLLYAQLLAERQDLPDDARTLAAQTAAGAEKLNFLIQSLIKTSRLESGIIKIIPQRSDLCEILNAALDECAAAANKKGLKLILDAPPLYVMCDPKWCAEAFFNILDNAVKYSENCGRVIVSAKSYEMFIRIDVKDTGRGIREEELPLMFRRFWRARESSDMEGVGVGLFLSREIFTACGGYIKVSSAEGKGSVFSIFLPRG